MLHFYDVENVLVRRWVPAQRRLVLEVWTGDGWAPYAHVDDVSRHGHRLSDTEALALLLGARERLGILPRLSESEAGVALRSRTRRA